MALVNSYEGFIFDYGGVLVHHQTDADQAFFAKIARLPQDVFSELYWSDRQDYDKGDIGGIEYWTDIARRANTVFDEKTIGELIEFDNVSWMNYDEPMWKWVEELRAAGKRVAILSNMPADLGTALKTKTERLSGFDHVTLSYEVRSAKPEPAIYEHCMEGIGTPPEQTLFLDDRIANVQGAEFLGLRAMQFTSRDEIWLRLRS